MTVLASSDIEEFVMKQMGVEQKKAYTVEVTNFHKWRHTPQGYYFPLASHITYDGKDYVLAHELAHHYGANENQANHIDWLYQHSKVGKAQYKLELGLAHLLDSLFWPINALTGTSNVKDYKEASKAVGLS